MGGNKGGFLMAESMVVLRNWIHWAWDFVEIEHFPRRTVLWEDRQVGKIRAKIDIVTWVLFRGVVFGWVKGSVGLPY